MPAHDRPKRHSVKAMTKTESAVVDAQRNKAAAEARRAASSAAATKKRTVKLTVDDVSERLSKMRIAGRRHSRRHRVTRRKARAHSG